MEEKKKMHYAGKVAALSVRQPWAAAIMLGKNVENRSWETLYRGELLIHASLQSESISNLESIDRNMAGLVGSVPTTTGALIGVVLLAMIVRDSRSKWAQPDQFHWVLRNPRAFKKPIPYKGQLGLFYVPIVELRGTGINFG